MKYCFLIISLVALLFTYCSHHSNGMGEEHYLPKDSIVELPPITVDFSFLEFDTKSSQWTYDSIPYSGYAESYYDEGQLKQRTGFLDGKKQNESVHLFPDRHLKRIVNYDKGKLHGVKKSWSPEPGHVLVSELNYFQGKANGVQTFWYPTGELYKRLSFNNGIEEGIQQAFRKNGELYANYEAKNGRIFGLKKAALCYGIEDENIKYEE